MQHNSDLAFQQQKRGKLQKIVACLGLSDKVDPHLSPAAMLSLQVDLRFLYGDGLLLITGRPLELQLTKKTPRELIVLYTFFRSSVRL